MRAPNIITLSRIPMLFIIVAFLYFRVKWFPTCAFFGFLIASWTDWLDGFIARRYDMTSDFGAFMDALTDKIFMLGVMITMFVRHILPEWCLFLILIIFTRELLITGYRAVAAMNKIVIPAQKEGKLKTVLQMVSVAVLLSYHCCRTDFIDIVPLETARILYFIGLFSFIGATILTVSSGIVYFRRFQQHLKSQ